MLSKLESHGLAEEKAEEMKEKISKMTEPQLLKMKINTLGDKKISVKDMLEKVLDHPNVLDLYEDKKSWQIV